jgi:hypothetical protein
MSSATLRLTRGWIGMQWRPFAIALDGEAVGTVAKRQTVELSVEPGRHSLVLHCGGRLRSPERTFSAGPDEVVEFSCHGTTIWPIYVAALVKPDLGVTLTQLP